MIQVVCGTKGKGKTKKLLEYANECVSDAQGEVVYLDKSGKNMYELNNQIRLIDTSEYPINTYDSFVGFLSGLIAGNHDIEWIFLDSFLKISYTKEEMLDEVSEALKSISPDVKFVISVSVDESMLSENVRQKILYSC